MPAFPSVTLSYLISVVLYGQSCPSSVLLSRESIVIVLLGHLASAEKTCASTSTFTARRIWACPLPLKEVPHTHSTTKQKSCKYVVGKHTISKLCYRIQQERATCHYILARATVLPVLHHSPFFSTSPVAKFL